MKKKKLLLGVLAFFCATVAVKAIKIEIPNSEDDYYELNWSKTLLAGEINSIFKEYYNGSFPSYYGGIYLSDDAKNVVLQIVKNNLPTKESEEFNIYDKVINMNESIIIEYVNYSYEELNDVNEKISEFLISDNNEEKKNIYSTSIDIMSNRVKVVMDDNSKSQQINFQCVINKSKESMNFDLINFVDGDEPMTYAKTLNAGGEIMLGNCSMGFRTKLLGNNGFVTAGHCAPVGAVVSQGKVTFSQFENQKNYDYAFVATNQNYSTTNNLAYTSGNITKLAVVNYCPEVVVNTAIAKVGISTKYTTGKVLDFNVTARYKNSDGTYTYIKGLVDSKLVSQPGDSGGSVFIPRSDSNGGAIPIGVLSGGDGTYTYFTDINNMIGIAQGRY